MSSDDLHDLKTGFDAPTLGISERLESTAKSITPALGLSGTSATVQRLARNFAVLMEYYKLAPIARKKNVSFDDGMSKHMFFVDDKIINALLVLGCGLAIISQFELILPLGLIGAIYLGSDKFIQTVEKL